MLLKTPETPVSLEERVKAYFAGTDVAASAETERCDVGKGYAALKMVADKRVPAVAFDAETRTLQLNTGELSVVVATFCRTTYRLTAPPESVVPSASVAEEGLRALGATLRGVLSTAFSGRKLRGTAVGIVERDDEQMRMIYWQEGEDPGSPVVLYTVVSEAYAQYAGRKLPRRAAAGAWPRWHTTSASASARPSSPASTRWRRSTRLRRARSWACERGSRRPGGASRPSSSVRATKTTFRGAMCAWRGRRSCSGVLKIRYEPGAAAALDSRDPAIPLKLHGGRDAQRRCTRLPRV